MERVLIIGGNGSGKTTLAKELSQRLKLPLIHLDKLYWTDHWEPAAKEEFACLLDAELIKPKWIIDGNIKNTLPKRLNFCDTVIFLDFSRLRCVWGAIKRLIQNHHKSRSDMGGWCEERFDLRTLRFLGSIWQRDRENRESFYRMLRNADGIKIIILKNRRQIKSFLGQV